METEGTEEAAAGNQMWLCASDRVDVAYEYLCYFIFILLFFRYLQS